MAASVLEATGLIRTYGSSTVVDDVSLRIESGETLGLLGPNGAGKTTTISMICGLLRPDAGSVHIAGEAMGPRSVSARRAVGLVPQELALYPDLTGAENLDFFGRVQGLSRDRLAERSAHVLEVVGLTDRAKDRVDTYSGGMQRRLNIAVGLLHEPALLILDEPTVGVDPQSRNAILEAVDELGRGGMALLYTTHYMEEAARLCDRVAIMDEGRILAEGTQEELLAQVGDAEQVIVTGGGQLDALARALAAIPGIDAADVVDPDRLVVQTRSAQRQIATILGEAANSGVSVEAVQLARPDLESVFLHLTGRGLRD